jgi:threonine dehydrogenase-like Zn-dependent dehydrogenase
VWRHPTIGVEAVPDPAPGTGEVVVQIERCGVCGSDTHCVETDVDGYVLFSGPARFPSVLGHEYAGRVVALGEGVRTLRVGELVTAEGMLYCGVCEACRRGQPNQCPRLRMVGFSAPGAYARYIVTHERHLWSLDAVAERTGSEAVALDHGALVEPVACAYNGIWVAGGGMAPGSHVAVFGCGPIGLGAIALCRAAGAASITAFDVVPERVALAQGLGADHAYLAHDGDPAERIFEHTGGWGADWVVEAAGAALQTVPTIGRLLAPGGTMAYLSRSADAPRVELDRMVTGAQRIVGSRGHAGGGCFPNILRMMAAGRLDARSMITHRMGLLDAAQGIERSRSRRDGKILLQGRWG